MRTLAEITLPENERHAIEAAIAALPARAPVSEIVLFGSKARGDSAPDSDIDLLVLTERRLDAEEEHAIFQSLYDIGLRFDVVFGPLTVEAHSWRQGVHSVLPIHAEVEREGVRCLDSGPAEQSEAGTGSDPAGSSREVLVTQAVAAWMGMAAEALASAHADLVAGRPRSTVNRAYYAAFYAVSAVLLSRGRHFVKHAGVQAALHRDFIRPGLLAAEHGTAYDRMFKLRLIADYTVTEISADEAARTLAEAQAIVAEMHRLLAGAV